MSDMRLIETTESALAAWPSGALCVALSGGLDSTVMLHVLASSATARARGLRAIHVDHGIHPESARWAAHCAAFAAALDVLPLSVRVDVLRGDGTGLEAAARRARYAAFEAALGDNEILVTAHHADDQAETVLLRLLRASGVAGLGAMQPWRAFGRGALARPWLAVPRDAIRTYAEAHALTWIDDPSNASDAHDRNYVRRHVMPQLRARWPHAAEAFVRSASLLRDAAATIDADTRIALAQAQGLDPATLRIDALRALAPYRRAELLRAWIASLALPAPTAQAIDALAALLDAREDANPIVAWPGAELRRYRDMVYAMAPFAPIDATWTTTWDGRQPLELPHALGKLVLDGNATTPLRVTFRQGGETIALAPSRPRRAVKDLLQDLGIPPWQRDRIPLVHDTEGLVAIADLVIAERFGARIRRLVDS